MLLTRRQIVLLIILTLVWGINWPVMKFGLRELTPLYFRGVTMAGGCLFLAAWLTYRGVSLKVSLQDLGRIFCLCLPNVAGWHMFSILGVQELASGRAAILGFTMPIWTAFLGALFVGQHLNARIWISIIAASAAVGLLTFNELTQLSGRPIGIIWMQIAAISWAIGILLFGRIKPQVPIEVTTVWMLAMGCVIFWFIASLTEPLPTWQFSNTMWIAMAYSIVINFGVAQLIWFGLATSLPPTASAFSVMAIPLVGIFAAAPLINEMPHLTDFIAAGCIMIAIASAVIRKPSVHIAHKNSKTP